MGRLYRTIDKSGTTKNTYDKAGRLIRVQYPDNKTVSYEYDAGSNRTKLTYPDNTYITYAYDELSRLTCVKNQAGTALATYTYDERSRRTGLDYLNGAGAQYQYDTANRLLALDNLTASGQYLYEYAYDYVGNRLEMTVTSPGGVGIHLYSYDDIYQITEVNYPDSLSYLATDTEFHYDAAGNRTSVIDGGGTCNYTTNNLNQYTAAGPTNFSYDSSGNMTHDANYGYYYDPENRLTEVRRPDPPTQQLNSFAAYTKGGDAVWVADPYGFAQSGSIDNDQESWMYIDVQGPGTVQFQWKVSSQEYCDYLEFYTDDQLRYSTSGEVDWDGESYTVSGSGSHRLKWRYVKDSDDYSGDDCGWVKSVTFTPPAWPAPDDLAEALDSGLSFTTGGDSGGWTTEAGTWCRHDWDCASGTTCDDGADWLQTTVSGAGTLKFWWKVSSEAWDVLEFYIDDDCKHSISGEQAWAEKTYTVTGAGTHTLRWRYAKDSSESEGEDRGWVDYVQWTGAMEEPDPNDWSTLNYVYDAAGRRIEKKYDGRSVLKYVYDGDHCIAEYDAAGTLKRKYLYGPGVDQPICMIEAPLTDPNYSYYHFDGSGNVVALTDAEGDTVQFYEYDVYGRVGILDASHPNRLMFTAREFDKETGLYYYRARYYKPEIGRFLQVDPVGYGAGMNLYRYCSNNPWNMIDPYGLDDSNDSNDSDCSKEQEAARAADEAFDAARAALWKAGTVLDGAVTISHIATRAEDDAWKEMQKRKDDVVLRAEEYVGVFLAGEVAIGAVGKALTKTPAVPPGTPPPPPNPVIDSGKYLPPTAGGVGALKMAADRWNQAIVAWGDALMKWQGASEARKIARAKVWEAAAAVASANTAYRDAQGLALVAHAELFACLERNKK